MVEKKEIKFRIHKDLSEGRESKIQKYCKMILGRNSMWELFKYEMILLFSSWIPGALGLFLRSKLYPLILGECGKNVVFGMNVTLRHPHKIKLGSNVIIDDQCLLDAKGVENQGITLGDNVFIGRNTILSSKDGDIFLEDNVNIGFNSEIFSGSKVHLGKNCLLAAYCYIIGGGHDFEAAETKVYDQSSPSLGIDLGEDVWLGAGVKVLDGVSIGRGAVVGTGAVVTKSLESNSVNVGIPAKKIRDRT